MVSLAPSRRLDLAAAVEGIDALHPSFNATEVSVIGPEAEAFGEVRINVPTKVDINSLYKPKTGSSLEGVLLAHEVAAKWCVEMVSGLKAYIQAQDFQRLPQFCLRCAANDATDVIVVAELVKDGGAEFCRKHGLSIQKMRKAVKAHKEILHKNLKVACSAYALAYLLNATAKIVSQAEMDGMVAAVALGIQNVRRYARLGTALLGQACSDLENIARKMITLVGVESEGEVRDEFKVPRPAFVVVETKKVAPAAPPIVVQMHTAPPKAPVQRLSHPEKVAAIVNQLTEMHVAEIPPTDFIGKWVRAGMLAPEKILAKYQDVRRHATRSQEHRDEGMGSGTAQHVFRSLDDSILAVRFGQAIEAAIMARGIKPYHVCLAVCKVFGFPSKPRPRMKDDATDYLAKYLNGKVQKPAKTADSVFSFMYDSGLLVGNDKTLSIDGGTKNPAGSAILAAIRRGFQG